MRNLKPIILILVLSFTISACQTIKNKTDEIVEKENQKLTKYIGKTSGLLKMDLGAPSEDFKNEKGNLILVYNTKYCRANFYNKLKTVIKNYIRLNSIKKIIFVYGKRNNFKYFYCMSSS